MPAQPTVGLVGSRVIDQGLQSSDKKTVTKHTFPAMSGTPNSISIPHEGADPNRNPAKLGDCYASPVEDTNLYAHTPPAARRPPPHAFARCGRSARTRTLAACHILFCCARENLTFCCRLVFAGSRSSSSL